MNTKINPQDVLSRNIKFLSESGMSKSDLDQIVWEWDESLEGYFFDGTPEHIASRVRYLSEQSDKSSLIDIIHSLARAL